MPNVDQIQKGTTTENVLRFFEESSEGDSQENSTVEDVLRSFAETSIDLDRDLERYTFKHGDW